MKIAMTGSTGFIGTALTGVLRSRGHEVTGLSRRELDGSSDLKLPQGTEALINMAGENIAGGRWTEAYRKKIRDSRIITTRSLVRACLDQAALGVPLPKVLVSFSAVGYYGTHPSAEFHETNLPGKSWLSQVAHDWEQEASRVEAVGIRLVILRLGVVLGPGGFLERMKTPFLFFAGGPAGSGQQWISWIHRDDVLAVVEKALESPAMQGAYNLTSPEPATMNEMAAAIGAALHRPSWLPTPAFMLRLAFGEMADELILQGQRALPFRLREMGYVYVYPSLSAAVADSLASR